MFGKADFAQTFNRLLREGDLGDISSPKLIFMDNCKRARVVRIIAASEPAIIHVVDYHTWISIVTQRCPAKVIVAPVPANPTRSPNSRWDPVPTETIPPMPSAVVVCAPTPGFVGDPGPAA